MNYLHYSVQISKYFEFVVLYLEYLHRKLIVANYFHSSIFVTQFRIYLEYIRFVWFILKKPKSNIQHNRFLILLAL